MALFSSQTIELIELLAIHAVCSLDPKDTMNSRGRDRLSRGLRVTVGPASRTRPPSPHGGQFGFDGAIYFSVHLLAAGSLGVTCRPVQVLQSWRAAGFPAP